MKKIFCLVNFVMQQQAVKFYFYFFEFLFKFCQKEENINSFNHNLQKKGSQLMVIQLNFKLIQYLT